MKSIRMFISGDLKGTGFGLFLLGLAEKYGIHGYMEYADDGLLFVKAEGQTAMVNKFVSNCIKGNDRAIIELVNIQNDQIMNPGRFRFQNFR